MSKNIEIYLGDCKEVLSVLPENSVDLIVTSPPYADQRKSTYGGVTIDKYVELFFTHIIRVIHSIKSLKGMFYLDEPICMEAKQKNDACGREYKLE